MKVHPQEDAPALAADAAAMKVHPQEDAPALAPAEGPASPPRDSVRISEDATARLKKAKAAGHAVRMRISGTMGLVGVILLTFTVISLYFFEVASDAAYLGVCVCPPGVTALMLALLPTDRRQIYRVAVFLSLLITLAVFARAYVAITYDVGDCREESEAPGWYCQLGGCVVWAQVLVLLGADVGFASALRLPPRSALDRLWKSVAGSLFGLGVARVVNRIPSHVVADVRDGEHAWDWLFLGFLLFFGGVTFEPTFRQRAHAWLMAQGGQISSAAGVAALLGNHDVEEVKKTAGGAPGGHQTSRCLQD